MSKNRTTKKRTTTDHIPFVIHSFGTNLSKFNYNTYDTGEKVYKYKEVNYAKKKTDSAVPSAELDLARNRVLWDDC